MCENLPTIQFGRPSTHQPASKRYRPEEHVAFVCQAGFKFNPNFNTVTCNSNGSWSQPPNCEPAQCTWHTAQPSGGVFMIRQAIHDLHAHQLVQLNSYNLPAVDRPYLYSSVVILTCQRGFVLVDKSITSTRCQANEQWTTPLPACKKIFCTVPSFPPNTLRGIGYSSQYRPGSRVPLESVIRTQCQPGYAAGGIQAAVQYQQCRENNQWSPIELCVLVTCPPPPIVANASPIQARANYSSGDYATYVCNPGYRFSTGFRARSLCTGKGTWYRIEPCQRVTCPRLSIPLNGQVLLSKKTAVVGTEASYSCHSGAVLIGGDSRHCSWDGTWTGTDPTCIGTS